VDVPSHEVGSTATSDDLGDYLVAARLVPAADKDSSAPSAIRMATARPMPLVAPVTKAVLPSNS
jgi:hypothetical protein